MSMLSRCNFYSWGTKWCLQSVFGEIAKLLELPMGVSKEVQVDPFLRCRFS